MWDERKMKHFMYGISVVILVASIGLTVIGLWMMISYKLTDYMNDSDIFSDLYLASYLFMGIGVVSITLTVAGIWGTIRRRVRFLVVFFVGLFILSAILLVLGVVIILRNGDTAQIFEKHLFAKFKDYDEKEFRKYLNNTQTLNCCGSIGYNDDYVNTCDRSWAWTCAFPLYLKLRPYYFASATLPWVVDLFMIIGMIWSLLLGCLIKAHDADERHVRTNHLNMVETFVDPPGHNSRHQRRRQSDCSSEELL